jgi:hypothetical protein
MYRKTIPGEFHPNISTDLAKDSISGVFSVMASHPTAALVAARNKDAQKFSFKRTRKSKFSTFIVIDFEFSMMTYFDLGSQQVY